MAKVKPRVPVARPGDGFVAHDCSVCGSEIGTALDHDPSNVMLSPRLSRLENGPAGQARYGLRTAARERHDGARRSRNVALSPRNAFPLDQFALRPEAIARIRSNVRELMRAVKEGPHATIVARPFLAYCPNGGCEALHEFDVQRAVDSAIVIAE